jgi:LCP family protein required for cell wall assembly
MFFPPEDGHTEDEPQPERPRRRRAWLALLIALVALVAVGLGSIGLFAAKVDQAVTDNLERRTDILPPDAPSEPNAKPRPKKKNAAEDALNYVLLGSDSRSPGNPGAGRSDVLMVLHLAADRKSAYLVSFPRDLYVPIPGRGKNKINAAFALGGPALTVRTLESLLDTRMDHVALIDFDGFVGLTEQLGGVRVYNRHSTVSQGYRFPTGYITVRGEEALAYVRERKQLPNGDLDRAERQRAVLQAILAKGMSRDVMTSPTKFISFAGGVARHVTVDDRMTDGELRKTALSLRMRSGDIKLLQAPITGLGTSPDKQSIVVVDQERLSELASAMQNDAMENYVSKYPAG